MRNHDCSAYREVGAGNYAGRIAIAGGRFSLTLKRVACLSESCSCRRLWRQDMWRLPMRTSAATIRLLAFVEITLSFASSMNILVIGGGGRDHALAWNLKQSAP